MKAESLGNGLLPYTDKTLTLWFQQEKDGVPEKERVTLSPEQQKTIKTIHMMEQFQNSDQQPNEPKKGGLSFSMAKLGGTEQ